MKIHLCAMLVALAAPTTAVAGPPATLADLRWLEGSWEGPGVGGAPATEVYSRAEGGQMPAHFRQLNPDGTVMFYELITIVERDGSLVYRLKHFNPDLTGWEAQGEVREFSLTARAGDRFTFEGLTYERTGPDTMTARAVSQSASGKEELLQFHFRRTGQ